MIGLVQLKKCINNTNGLMVVEAAILLPIIFAVFLALVLLSMYLPAKAALQRATQYAATAMATEKSDTWLFFNEDTMSYHWESDKDRLENVYLTFFRLIAHGNVESAKAEMIVRNAEEGGVSLKNGDLIVEYGVVDYMIYKEIIVSATRTMPVPRMLSAIEILRFPTEIPITVTSSAVVQDGDEFVRNMDIAADFVEYMREKLELDDIAGSIGAFGNEMGEILGWKND